MTIALPLGLERVLKGDSTLHGLVLQNFEDFEPWLSGSGLPFFPEYTDHGPKHISAVLESATELITSSAFDVISAGDAAVLALATLLHDAALHIKEDGFADLVTRGADHVLSIDEKPWPMLWQEFLMEARRFNGKTLKRLFGDSQAVRIPPLDASAMTGRDRLLIGEFIRRNHARLAHEIALFGVPGPPSTEHLRLMMDSEEMLDLCGFVARSHGIALRSCLDYLDRRFHLRDYRGIHAVFIMTALRIADYIQIQSDRAPRQLRKVCTLKSPISQREWDVHNAVRNITFGDTDPEAIMIQARPPDLRTFLRLKEWLEGIQSELDLCWAVLGEVYGRYTNENLHMLGLTLRRVKSDISNISAGTSAVPFVPVKTSFEAAGSELLKLLIRPLYGNNPEIGVRELVQNAVDAVLELRFMVARSPEFATALTNRESEVTVCVARNVQGTYELSIVDSGVGMTAETVGKYFLRAGASSRNTENWLQVYADESGHSQVLRSGRFGIGALAAFLLGDSLQVATRHIASKMRDGVSFSATLDDDIVELRRAETPVGTSIRIPLAPDVASFLEQNPRAWDWYALEKPSPAVARIVNGRKLPQQYRVPSVGEDAIGWHRLAAVGFDDVQWTYGEAPLLTCNGILVRPPETQESGARRLYRTDAGVTLRWPNISVFDSDGNMPLNLQRTALAGELPFKDRLLSSVIADFVRACASQAPSQPIWARGAGGTYWTVNYAGVEQSSTPEVAPWFYTPFGVCLFDRILIGASDPKSVLIVNDDAIELLANVRFNGPIFIIKSSAVDRYRTYRRFSESSGLHPTGMRVFIPASVPSHDIAVSDGNPALQRRHVEASNKEFLLIRFGECGAGTISFDALLNPGGRQRADPLIAEWHLGASIARPISALAAVWERTIGEPAVPFDSAGRAKYVKQR
jgi:molecular chaperone HtpG